jgi:hypothetical protein
MSERELLNFRGFWGMRDAQTYMAETTNSTFQSKGRYWNISYTPRAKQGELRQLYSFTPGIVATANYSYLRSMEQIAL